MGGGGERLKRSPSKKEKNMTGSKIVMTFAIAAVVALTGLSPSAKAQGQECSNLTLRGTFADKDTGFLTAPPAMAGPFAGVSVENFDGRGGMTGSGMASLNGTILQSTFKGTYTVNADCSGTYTVQNSLGLTIHGFFVIADNGNELHVVITDPGTVINCLARRMFPGRSI
jgi:hypothetical protein